MGRLALLLAFLLPLLRPAPARADKAFDALVKTGVGCYEALNFGCAIGRLQNAVARVDRKETTPQKAQALLLYRTLAFALASVERHEKAALMFVRCFGVKADFRLDPKIVSPKIYGDYKRARQQTLGGLLLLDAVKPALPQTVGQPPPSWRDLQTYVPAALLSVGRVQPDAGADSRVALYAGARMLFGEDGERFDHGFALGMEYLYAVADSVEVGVTVLFSQHGFAGQHAKLGYPSTLYILDPGLAARYVLRFGEYIDLSLGLGVGASTAGLGTLGESNSAWISGYVGLLITPSPEFGVGVSVLPGVALGETASGDTGGSFTLPLFLRFETRF